MAPRPDSPPCLTLWDLGLTRQEARRHYVGGIIALVVGILMVAPLAFMVMMGVAFLADALGGPSARQVVEGLAIFPVVGSAIIPMAVVVRAVHGRTAASLVNATGRVSWALLARGAGLWAGVLLPLVALGFASGEMSLSPDWPRVLLVASIGLPLVLAQVTAEEMLCRGYLAQACARLTGSPVTTVLVTTLVFTALHEGNQASDPWGLRVQIAAMGLFLALVTWKAGRLEPAVGIHLAQNMLAVFVLGAGGEAIPNLAGRSELAVLPDDPAAILGNLAAFCLPAGVFLYLGFGKGWLGMEKGRPDRPAALR